MPDAPDHLRVRSYNVGFGDCFLLSFSYNGRRSRHVLIDFGSTKAAARGARPMIQIAKQIEADCRGKLDMVVATHRHADHISGFAGKPGEVIRALEPELVVQPWTEDPDIAPAATAPAAATGDRRARAAMQARLSDMQAVAEAVVKQLPHLQQGGRIPKTVAAQLAFLGQTNIKNEPAVTNLMTMGKRRVYASFGSRLPIARVLPGIKIDVLGPPTLRQSKAIAEQARTDPDEFWHIAARRARKGGAGGGAQLFPRAATAATIPQEARWVIPQIDRMRAEELLAIVRSLDAVLNNTSLILLFEIGGSLLLFPGDAQLENWNYALRENPQAEQLRRRLEGVRLYKVGHHGSLNATPKTLWKKFSKAGAPGPDRLATVLSTAAGKHGHDSRGTEVPRKVLVEELERSSDLFNTQKVTSVKTFWNELNLDL
jgi:beta-lactamase superfamily II metal-dependent hydrolase